MGPQIVIDIETFDFAIRSVVGQLESSERLDAISDALRDLFMQGDVESETRLKQLVASEVSISNLINGTLIMLRSIASGLKEVQRFVGGAPTTEDADANEPHEDVVTSTMPTTLRRYSSPDVDWDPVEEVQPKKFKEEAFATVRDETSAAGTSKDAEAKISNEPTEASSSVVQASSDQKCAVSVHKIDGRRRYPLTYKMIDGRYLCDFCVKTYAHPKDLRTHYQKVHEQR